MQSIIYWNDAQETEPTKLQTILVVYEGAVRAGVYAAGEVLLYPEDFGKVRLRQCKYWAALPLLPESKNV